MTVNTVSDPSRGKTSAPVTRLSLPDHDTPRRSVSDALFGDLLPQDRQRFGLPQDDAATARSARMHVLATTHPEQRNAAIRHIKKTSAPPRLPGAPASPWHLRTRSWIEVIRRVGVGISENRVSLVAAGVTFFGLLALFPAITALVSIFGMFADSQAILDNLDTLDRFLPDGAAGLIRGQITAIVNAPGRALGLATFIGIATALYSSMAGMRALIKALNMAWFQSENRGFIKLNLMAFILTLGAMLMVMAFVLAISILPPLVRLLTANPAAATAAAWARWPLLLVLLLIALAVLYRVAPNRADAKWQWISPGALFATVALIAASLLFSWYTANFANYNKTYGALGAAVVLMIWLWIACMVLLVGAQLNSEIERQIQSENGIPLEDDDADEAAA